ncbi:MAG: hypothetical protein IKI75_06430 [Lachnospiraceae bacterium]|nr:hypothetical protein [Lachnospiraceae bacterium]
MECKNCGASYRLKALRCPYCETENLLGRMLVLKRTETIKRYEEEQKLAKKKYVPYVASKMVNTLILVFALLVLAALFYSTGALMPRDEDGKLIDKHAEKLFDAGKYDELYDYLDGRDLFGRVTYRMAQAALMAHHYEEFLTYRIKYIRDGAVDEDAAYTALTMHEAMSIYQHHIGMYTEYYEENEPEYEEYNRRIMAFWRGTMMCDDDDIAFLSDPDNWWHSGELQELCEKLNERRRGNDG